MTELEKLKKQISILKIERDQLYDCLKDMQSRRTSYTVQDFSHNVNFMGQTHRVNNLRGMNVTAEYTFDEELFDRMNHLLENKFENVEIEEKQEPKQSINKYDFISKE